MKAEDHAGADTEMGPLPCLILAFTCVLGMCGGCGIHDSCQSHLGIAACSC